MAWKKYFTTVPSQAKMTARLEQLNKETAKAGTSHKFSSYLPEVYAGAPNRIERYVAYDQADLDSEINRALDTIAEFCTQNQDDDNPIPFRIIYRGDVTETETELLTTALQQWNSINKFNQRIFRIFRNAIKYGDQFFIRDPETYELLWVDASKVEKIIVNEAEGKKIEQYVIKDLDINLQSQVATNPLVNDQYSFPGGYPRSSNPASGSGNINYGQPTTPGSRTSRFFNPANSIPVDGAHVVHLSLSEGMDQHWPFGISILEAVYKTYKQKDLLEDCILIYRIVRAPERRVFYIDVGQLQGQRAMQYVERVKNEIYQRRMPNRTGGGSGSVIDTAYNPISITEDFFLATNNEQRGTKIENLAAGENLGCFSLDTKIKLLDGRDLSIGDIEKEMSTGKTLWTFSCHPVTGAIAPGKITWAGKTRSNAQVIRLTLDTGETITCTPDHKFPIRGIGFVEAQNLVIGQSLTALYTKQESVNKRSNCEYTQYYDHIDGKWQFVHRMVASFMKAAGEQNNWCYKPEFVNSKQNVVHHVDHNRFNNNPENLVYMNWTDHRVYHNENGFTSEAQQLGTISARKKVEHLKNYPELNAYIAKQTKGRKIWRDRLTPVERAELINKMRKGLRAHFTNMSEEKRTALNERLVANSKKGVIRKKYLLENDTKFKINYGNSVKTGIRRNKELNPDVWNTRSKTITNANLERWASGRLTHIHEQQRYMYTDQMLQKITQLYCVGNHQLSQLVDTLNKDTDFLAYWNTVNTTLHNQTKFEGFGVRHVHSILETFGMDWDKFRIINTKIVENSDEDFKNILKCVNQSDSQVEFTKISNMTRYNMLKITSKYGLSDYRLVKAYADTMNHRVVKIEYLTETMDVGTLTVDGDEQYHDYHTYALSVGVFVKNSIDDLRYFSNKLLRGLGIPSSYLPTGPDDGTAVYSDGKLGTAFIQEYRFNKYCQRLQNHFSPIFDLEFKLFLKARGLEVHSSLFELAFNTPQSFSEYRNMALDAERVNLFSQVMGSDAAKYMSKRFALEKYLGWTQEDILENEKLWKEENSNRVKEKTGLAPAEGPGVGLGSIGIRPELEDTEIGAPEAGAEELPPETPTETPPAGGAPAAETPAPTL